MRLRAAISSSAVLWFFLALPGCYILLAYTRGRMVYGEFIHWSGDLAAWLLLFTLALTPLRSVFPRCRWTAWLLQGRRYFGVASFMYAALHVGAYLIRQPRTRLMGEALEWGMLTGWVAFAILLPLAATSNDASVRALGRAWKRVHRWVYAAAVLTFAHWALTAFDPVVAYVHCAVLGAILALRFGVRRR
jgi:methionine sulfoxide reductase heme-binding subunit